MDFSCFKLEIFAPEEAFDAICGALWRVDAGHIGGYDRCLSWSEVESCWRPLEGTSPYLGQQGQLCRARERKIEVTVRKERLEETLTVVKAVHPYEEPVINVLPLWGTGL